jgi:dTDP-4-amino-4,6-dideoxygalactose transaminase
MIPFNRPPYTGHEDKHVLEAMKSAKMSGDGPFTKKCQAWFEDRLDVTHPLLTPSCTHALELAALVLDIQPGDEVIMPSYTFVSTSNAFVLRGAKIVFVDIRPDTMNIDETLIEDAITDKTKAIVPVHYAGVGCEMDAIMEIAHRHNLKVVEDAAQGVNAFYKGRPLGAIGDMGAFSFHDTKNYTSGGEGGLFITPHKDYAQKAEIYREKGTNRSLFFRGMVDKYSWVDQGSSYLPGELQTAYLWGQLEQMEAINADRLKSWMLYYDGLSQLARDGYIERPHVPEHCTHNAHMFYIKTKDVDERQALIEELKTHEIGTAFHYVPLHSAKAGQKYGRLHGEDKFTTAESERLLRLPMYFGLMELDIVCIVEKITAFYKNG